MNSVQIFPKNLFHRFLFIVVFAALGYVAIWNPGKRQLRPSTNRLAITQFPYDNDSKISLDTAKATDSSHLTIKNLLSLRQRKLEEHPGFLDAPYRPSDVVFARIDPNLPWKSEAVFSALGPTQEAITGASHDGQFILNPHLLVGAEFTGLSAEKNSEIEWTLMARKRIQQGDEGILLTPPLVTLEFEGSRDSGEIHGRAVYDVSRFLAEAIQHTERRPKIENISWNAVAINARDLNLRYIKLDSAESRSIIAKLPTPTPTLITDFFKGPLFQCGQPRGCNGHSRVTPRLQNLTIVSLPARASFRLWRSRPEGKPDLKFSIDFQ